MAMEPLSGSLCLDIDCRASGVTFVIGDGQAHGTHRYPRGGWRVGVRWVGLPGRLPVSKIPKIGQGPSVWVYASQRAERGGFTGKEDVIHGKPAEFIDLAGRRIRNPGHRRQVLKRCLSAFNYNQRLVETIV